MNALLEKYKALTEREQKLVLVSAVLLIIALFYFAVWSPLNAALDKQKQLLDNQQSLLVWVKDSAARAQQLRRSSGRKLLVEEDPDLACGAWRLEHVRSA